MISVPPSRLLASPMAATLTSIWLPLQLGIIAVVALAAIAIATLVRRRFDLGAATMGWPPYLRLAVRALIDNFSILIFILVGVVSYLGFRQTKTLENLN